MNKHILYIMVGLPGSGKSTCTKDYPSCVVVSTDEIRKELYGDENIQGDGNKVFSIAYDRIKEQLKDHDVIFEATNINRKYRKKLLKIDAYRHIAIWMNTDLNECLKRNLTRDRVVPDDIILSMHERFEEPTIKEGFDYIIKY